MTTNEWKNAHDTIRAAADLGTACAWVEVFARVVVPLGKVVWQTGRPEVGRIVVARDGYQIRIENYEQALAWHHEARESPDTDAWRYID